MSARKMKSKSKPKGPQKKRILWRFMQSVLALLLLAVIMPPVLVFSVRFIDPPRTPLMAQRWIEARLEGNKPAPVRYRWQAMENVPLRFAHFVLVSEDQRFFQHDGIDWTEMRIAMDEARDPEKKARGASTISMQCARSLFLWQGRSRLRKGAEIYFTFWMEKLLSKHRILELYVNVIEMGDGIYGIHAAAQAHFKRDSGALTDNQMALLAGMLPNPRQWNPVAPGPTLRARQKRILSRAPAWQFPKDWKTQ